MGCETGQAVPDRGSEPAICDRLLEGDLVVWKPREPNRCRGDGLRAWQVDGSFPFFVGEVAVDLKVAAYAFDHLDIEIVDRCPAKNEVFRSFLVAKPKLNPLIPAQVIGHPRLTAFVLATYPVAEKLALIRVALSLDALVVHEVAALAVRDGGIGGSGFDTHVQLCNARHMGKV